MELCTRRDVVLAKERRCCRHQFRYYIDCKVQVNEDVDDNMIIKAAEDDDDDDDDNKDHAVSTFHD